jgi:hypothetical protein
MDMPFRLRVGNFYRERLSDSYEICVYNPTSIPEQPTAELLGQLERNLATLWSRALLILELRNLSTEDTKLIRHGCFPSISAVRLDELRQTLNQFIIAYYTVAEENAPGNHLHELSWPAFYRCVTFQLLLAAPENYELSDENVASLFELRPTFRSGGMPLYRGKLADLDHSSLRKISGMMDAVGDHIFYEFAFLAESRRTAHDVRVSLLMAVIALEAVHASLLRLLVCDALANSRAKHDIVSDYLRSAGFSTASEMTAWVLLPPEERPSADAVASCLRAVAMRNGIMHALVKNSGRYKVRDYSDTDIGEACDSVMFMYKHFLNAWEKRSRASGASELGSGRKQRQTLKGASIKP